MVDMGSLEEIYKYTENLKNIDIGIINNVTTKLALDIGCMIMEGEGIETILEEAANRNQHRYLIVRQCDSVDLSKRLRNGGEDQKTAGEKSAAKSEYSGAVL